MKECVLCKTRYQKGSGVTFHKFPTDEKRLELWLKNIEKPSWCPKKYDYICSKHFTDDCFIKHNSCTTLKKCSIPTILCSSAKNVSSTHGSMVLPTPSVSGINRKRRSTNCDPQQSIASKKARSKLESSPPTHEKMVAPTPSVSGTRTVTPTPSVSGRKAVEVTSRLIMEQNDTILSCRKRQSTSCDPQQSIVSKKARSKLESPPSTQKIVATIPSVSGTRMVTPTPSVSGKIFVEGKRRIIMEQDDTILNCQKRQSSCDPQQSTPSKKVRSLSEVCDNIKHDHRYENTPKSSKKVLKRVKHSLKKSRARVKVLSQHVKRLKVSVFSLRTVISELKKKK